MKNNIPSSFNRPERRQKSIQSHRSRAKERPSRVNKKNSNNLDSSTKLYDGSSFRKVNEEDRNYNFPSFKDNEIKEAFDCFDINSNGYISTEELRYIFKLLSEEVLDEELDEMIRLANKEGDGQVSWPGFYEFISGIVTFY